MPTLWSSIIMLAMCTVTQILLDLQNKDKRKNPLISSVILCNKSKFLCDIAQQHVEILCDIAQQCAIAQHVEIFHYVIVIFKLTCQHQSFRK